MLQPGELRCLIEWLDRDGNGLVSVNELLAALHRAHILFFFRRRSMVVRRTKRRGGGMDLTVAEQGNILDETLSLARLQIGTMAVGIFRRYEVGETCVTARDPWLGRWWDRRWRRRSARKPSVAAEGSRDQSLQPSRPTRAAPLRAAQAGIADEEGGIADE